MYEKTCDKHIYILSRTGNTVEYLDSISGDYWKIHGTCNQCGDCWQGAASPPPVLDCPVRPEIAEYQNCVLTGEYIVNNSGK